LVGGSKHFVATSHGIRQSNSFGFKEGALGGSHRQRATGAISFDPLFSHVLFPTYLGALIWLGLYLRDARLRALVPLRQ